MREITPENAAEYLHETGRVAPGRAVGVRSLGWGVSNVVMRVDVEGEPPFVLKQAREKLRTRALWLSRLDRIWTERAALDLLGGVLPEGTVPRVVFSDEDNFLFAMTCAPDDAAVWKEQLLAGQVDPAVARRAGETLAAVHTATRGHPALEGRLADTTVFDELRVDPFYREIARAHPELSPRIEALIASMSRSPLRGLVLGDFSPKNILVHARGLTLVDFETAHAGDPAYDVGFFLSHLWLKGFRAAAASGDPADAFDAVQRFEGLETAFRAGYRARGGDPDLVPPAFGGDTPVTWHMAACALARVDGKSPVDYLDERTRAAVRGLTLGMLRHAPVA